MKTKHILLALSLTFLSNISFAEESLSNPNIRPIKPEMKEAWKDCKAHSPINSEGKPDRMAMRQCLESKGINPPKRHKMSHENKAAFKECHTQLATNNMKADRAEMKQCLEAKGVKMHERKHRQPN